MAQLLAVSILVDLMFFFEFLLDQDYRDNNNGKKIFRGTMNHLFSAFPTFNTRTGDKYQSAIM